MISGKLLGVCRKLLNKNCVLKGQFQSNKQFYDPSRRINHCRETKLDGKFCTLTSNGFYGR